MSNSLNSHAVNVHLIFDQSISQEAIVCKAAKKFDVEFSITKASISARCEGYMVLELRGSKEACEEVMEFWRDNGVVVSLLAQRIWHDEDSCLDCGACTSLCPTKALAMDSNHHLVFDKSLCVVCLNCTNICPVHALKSDIDILESLAS